MKTILFIVLAFICIIACKNVSTSSENKTSDRQNDAIPTDAKYECKSGILIQNGRAFGMDFKTTTYFDEYGKVTLEVNTQNNAEGKLNIEKKLTIHDTTYLWSESEKEGIKSFSYKINYRNTEELAKSSYKLQSDETIDGKLCKVYLRLADNIGNSSIKEKIYIWKGIPIQQVTIEEKEKIDTLAVGRFKSFDENPSIPVSTFEIPNNIKFISEAIESE